MERFNLESTAKTINYAFEKGDASLVYSPKENQGPLLEITLPYRAAFGGGERYNTINLMGRSIKNMVEEKFCSQGDKTYCPVPFFFTDSGFGLYVNTGKVSSFAFSEGKITVKLPAFTEIVLFSGSPQSILKDFMSLFGPAKLPPQWAFLPWISANRWSSQKKAEEQISLLKEYDFPAGVIVLEAWSDEATFYIFNGAKYTAREGGIFSYEDFIFDSNGPWPNPKAMIEKIHAAGLKLVLWQIPVYKKQEKDEVLNAQNELDRAAAAEEKLCVMAEDGRPYTIPEGNWFAGSMIPDYTNPKTKTDWFAKRQYLLDIGVDGFKTDGGEFIYREDLLFSSGTAGSEMKNLYGQSYTEAYTEFLPENKVLFSRAGYAGQHTTPILWAGDQQSTFEELRSQLRAGLSAAMSGIIFWGFDIGGFAGPLPSPELYLRASQTACFCPIMQWHSEPDGGQFREILATKLENNERSPWNMAKASKDPNYIDKIRFYHKLREELLPYIYKQAQKCADEGKPLIYPLAYRWPEDENTYNIDDQFMLGEDILVAPILFEGQNSRKLYLPKGRWKNYFSGETHEGNAYVSFQHEWHIPVFLSAGSALAGQKTAQINF